MAIIVTFTPLIISPCLFLFPKFIILVIVLGFTSVFKTVGVHYSPDRRVGMGPECSGFC